MLPGHLKKHTMTQLRNLLLACCLVLSGFSGFAQQNNAVADVLAAENQFPRILESNDVDALDALLYHEFTVQSNVGGFLRKKQLLQNFRNGKNPYLKFRPHADSVVLVNDHMAISSGKELYAHKDGPYANVETTRFFYHVWIKEDGKWLLAGRVTAMIPEKEKKVSN